jgi:hypothetical protein
VDISWVKCSDIPDNAIALTTDLGTGKLLLQFFGNEMVFVPELHSSCLRCVIALSLLVVTSQRAASVPIRQERGAVPTVEIVGSKRCERWLAIRWRTRDADSSAHFFNSAGQLSTRVTGSLPSFGFPLLTRNLLPSLVTSNAPAWRCAPTT